MISTVDEIRVIYESYDPRNFDPLVFLGQARTLLAKACDTGGEYDPRSTEKAEKACNAYGTVSNLFLANGFRSAAESLLVDAWNHLGSIQREEKHRIYRAGLAMYLAKVYLKLGEKGSALRWALHTQADDLLGEHKTGGGAGKQVLRGILGMSDLALHEFSNVATQNLEAIRSELGNDWSRASGFAEDVVLRFALEKPEFAHLFSLESSMNEFPLSKAYFSALLDEVNTVGGTTKDIGDSLENLASYLFLLIPGWVPRRNLLDEQLAFESDIVVRNINPASDLTTELLGRHFLVECKNWEKPVGVSDVGYFLYRMRLTHAGFGVIFAKSGITGAVYDEKAARAIVRKAFHEDGSICVVLTGDDLVSLATGLSTFWPILLELIERVRFGKPRATTSTKSAT